MSPFYPGDGSASRPITLRVFVPAILLYPVQPGVRTKESKTEAEQTRVRTDPHYAVRGLGGRVRTLNSPSSTGGRDDGTEEAGEGSCQTVGKVRVFEMLTWNCSAINEEYRNPNHCELEA